MTTIFVHRDDADANPEFVAALERAGAEVLVVDIDPAELAGVTITEADRSELAITGTRSSHAADRHSRSPRRGTELDRILQPAHPRRRSEPTDE